MPAIDAGGQSAGGSTIFGIPAKFVIIGGGAAALAFFLINRSGSSKSADTGSSDSAVYGQALGPNAALALGSLETQVLQQSGKLQEQAQGYYDQMTGQLASGFGSLGTRLDTQAQNLSGIATGVDWISNQALVNQQLLLDEAHEIRTGIATQIDPAHAQQYRDLQTAFSKWLGEQFLTANENRPIASLPRAA